MRAVYTSRLRAPPESFAGQLGSINALAWSPDGKDLLLSAEDRGSPSVWRLRFDQPKLVKIADLSALDMQASSDGRYIYLRRRPAELIRIPIAGGPVEHVASEVLEFAVGTDEVYIERQDLRPPSPAGLNLYRVDSAGAMPQFVANLGFLASSMSVFARGQQIGLERREPLRTRLVFLSNRYKN